MEIWSLEHREAQHSQDSLDVLAAKYTADLIDEGVALKELAAACLKASRRWSFFPKMADILAAVDQYRSNPPPKKITQNQIEDTTSRHDLTPEEIARNKERIGLITGALAGRLTWDEAEKECTRLAHIGHFETLTGPE